jgi:2-polyprenyl-3-methyl-5-hydroxy-6-metoxy-1,4-benzoquinol methylase
MTTIAWEDLYKSNKTPWREAKPNIDELLTHSGVSGGTALDLGCGTGEWAVGLAKKEFTVEALDFSEEALKVAQLQTGSDAVNFVHWDLEELAHYSFKHPFYDLILDEKVLAFIRAKQSYLDAVHSVLKGVYVLTIFHEHDENPIICVPKAEFDRLVLSRFKVLTSTIINPRPGKVVATYYLTK